MWVFATESFTAEADLQAIHKTNDTRPWINRDGRGWGSADWGLVLFVLCICLKIGLGRETFSCENHKKCPLNLVGKLSNRVEHYFAGRTTTLCFCKLKKKNENHLTMILFVTVRLRAAKRGKKKNNDIDISLRLTQSASAFLSLSSSSFVLFFVSLLSLSFTNDIVAVCFFLLPTCSNSQ